MIPETIKTLISQIISENCTLTIEKGGDSSGDYWIDFAKNQKCVNIHYISDTRIELADTTHERLYGEGSDGVFSNVSEAIQAVNNLL